MARFTQPSPSAPFLNSLFGYSTKPAGKGGFRIGEATGGGLFDEQALGDITAYIRGASSNPYTAAFGNINTTGNFSALPPELLAPYQQATGTLDQLIGTSRPVVESLIQTGNPVDVTNLVNSRLQNTILPQISERFNPAEGTGFQNIAAREAANLIAELDVPAQEAARARQMEALTVASPTLAALTSERLGLPAAALGELSRISQLSDPGGRLMSALLSLLAFTQQPAEQGQPSGGGGGSGTGGILGSIGSLIGGVCWVAEELFGPLDLRTHLARAWCLANPNDPFVQNYRVYGRAWAAYLREHPAAKLRVAPVWEELAERGAALLIAH